MDIKRVVIMRNENGIFAAKGGELIGYFSKSGCVGDHLIRDVMDSGCFGRDRTARIYELNKLSPLGRVEGRDLNNAVVGWLNAGCLCIVKDGSAVRHCSLPFSLLCRALACSKRSWRVMAPAATASTACENPSQIDLTVLTIFHRRVE